MRKREKAGKLRERVNSTFQAVDTSLFCPVVFEHRRKDWPLSSMGEVSMRTNKNRTNARHDMSPLLTRTLRVVLRCDRCRRELGRNLHAVQAAQNCIEIKSKNRRYREETC